jgi:hypothetical protein
MSRNFYYRQHPQHSFPIPLGAFEGVYYQKFRDEKFNNIANFKTGTGKKYAEKTVKVLENDRFLESMGSSIRTNLYLSRQISSSEIPSPRQLLKEINEKISALEKAAKEHMHWWGTTQKGSTERAKIQQEINELMPSYERLYEYIENKRLKNIDNLPSANEIINPSCASYRRCKTKKSYAGKSSRKVKNTKNRRTKYRRAIIN